MVSWRKHTSHGEEIGERPIVSSYTAHRYIYTRPCRWLKETQEVCQLVIQNRRLPSTPFDWVELARRPARLFSYSRETRRLSTHLLRVVDLMETFGLHRPLWIVYVSNSRSCSPTYRTYKVHHI